MKILEVRDGFIKFEADENVFLSSFVEVESCEKRYICQVIQLRQLTSVKMAYAKILFLYNNGFSEYDKTLPQKDDEVKEFDFEEIAKLFKPEKPVLVGKTVDSYSDISIDISEFDKKMLISADEKEDDLIIVSNLISEFNKQGKNVIVVDTLGRLDLMKYTAGVDFKLPLNTSSLEFMYEECLNDATDESKALIEEIFNDLSEYSKTVPFVPFETLKTIVDDMVDNSHILKLLVLKNKLSKYSRMGYFASKKEEVDKLKLILTSRSAVLDLSKLDTAFQNKYLKWIHETLKSSKNTQIIVELSNVVSKQSLKMLFTEESAPLTFVTHSKFKYLNDIKNVFENFILVPSIQNNEIFKVYATFLKSMEKGTCLIVGKGTKYIPLVSKIFDNKTADFEEDNTALEELIEDSQKEAETEKPEEEKPVLSEADLEDKPKDDTENKNAFSTVVHPEVVDMFGSDDEGVGVSEEAEVNIEIEESVDDTNEGVNKGVNNKDSAGAVNKDINSEKVDETDDAETSLPEIEAEHDDAQFVDLENGGYETIEVEDKSEIDSPAQYEPVELSQEDDYPDEIQEIAEPDTIEEEIIGSDEIEILDESQEDDIPEYTEELQNTDELTSVELGEDIDIELPEDTEYTETDEIVENISEQEDAVIEEPEVLPIEDDNENFNVEEIQELDLSESGDDDIIVDMSEDFEEEVNDNVEDEIVKDVDKVYTTRKDDDISDSDLDFIDELNSDENEELLEEIPDDDSVLEELSAGDEIEEINEISLDNNEEENNEPPSEILETRESSTPIVPVYDADIPQEDLVMSDPIQQGDSVVHAKYGSGVVEKMIKYGNKTLYSINFDNIGRRLLDPTLTEIKKS